MSAIFIRFGLYTILLMLAVFVLGQYVELPFGDFLTSELLGQVGIAGIALVVIGFILGGVEKQRSGKRRTKGKCIVCKRPILVGEMYCREHLREVIAEEVDRRHAPQPRR